MPQIMTNKTLVFHHNDNRDKQVTATRGVITHVPDWVKDTLIWKLGIKGHTDETGMDVPASIEELGNVAIVGGRAQNLGVSTAGVSQETGTNASATNQNPPVVQDASIAAANPGMDPRELYERFKQFHAEEEEKEEAEYQAEKQKRIDEKAKADAEQAKAKADADAADAIAKSQKAKAEQDAAEQAKKGK